MPSVREYREAERHFLVQANRGHSHFRFLFHQLQLAAISDPVSIRFAWEDSAGVQWDLPGLLKGTWLLVVPAELVFHRKPGRLRVR